MPLPRSASPRLRPTRPSSTLSVLLFTWAAALALPLPAQLPVDLRDARAAAATITEGEFFWRVGVLAHDSMRGRPTPSPELDETARWVADEFRKFGLEPGGDDGTFIQRYPIPSAETHGSLTSAPNVVGIMPGSDPALRDQYVVFSAHMDHVGIGAPDATGDSIYNGADDDASGTVAVVEVAEAVAALTTRPARSMIFLLVSGEERGLWGSAHFAKFPSVPLERLIANLNADMVGRNWSDTIVAVGSEHSDLGETLATVNALHPELGMTVVDDPWPDQRFYFRSDHYNFARRGVPALFFFSGIHADYHRPSDEVENINAEKASRVARLVFYLGLAIANSPDRPSWNPRSYREIVDGGRGP